MRIAVINNTPLTAPGGAARIAQIYAEGLAKRGHELRVWNAPSAFLSLAKWSPVRRLFFHLADLRANKGIVRDIATWKPDVLLTHNLTGCGFRTPKALKDKGIVWTHVLHDVQLFEPSGQIISGESFGLIRSVWRKSWAMLRRSALGRPDLVLSPTRWLLEKHRTFGFFSGIPVKVMPNPIVLESVSADRDDRQLMYLGRLDADKGIDLVLEAWKQVRSEFSRLVLVGDGEWRERIVRMNDMSILVVGPKPNEEARRFLAQSGVVVVPSRVWENQPTAILEALAAGCRVVATAIGGSPETLARAGWIVPANSVSALVDGLRRALNAEPDPLRDEERHRVLKLHDPDVVLDEVEGALRSILKTRTA